MVEHRKLLLPPEIDEILDRLPPQVTLNVPRDVLSRWFSAEPNDAIDKVTLERAQNYARAVDAGLGIMRASVKAFSTDRGHPRSDAAHAGELPRRGCTVALIQFPWEPRGRAATRAPSRPCHEPFR